MKRQFLAIPLLITVFCFVFSTKISATVTPCDGGTGVPCTKCTPNNAYTACEVSGTSSCAYAGYLPDSVFCQNLPLPQCGDPMMSNCLEPTPIPSVPPTNTPTPSGSPTPTPPSQCYECVGVTLGGCIPHPAGDPNCEYDTYYACNLACTGQTPLLYSCSASGCNEDQNGQYTDLAACTSACNANADNSRFCGTPPDEANGINTAIGCIKVGSGNDLIKTILRLALGLGGGLALALILYGTFIVTTSAGMPDKLKAGGEIITSAIIGLIFILLSIFLVNFIGINILGIPGLI